MRRAGVALALSLALCSASHAQWLYQGQESAFDDDALQIAVTAEGQYALGFRCKRDNIEVVYMTPDKSFQDADAYKMANLAKPKIRIRIDNNPIVDIDAFMTEAGGKATIIGETDLEMLESIRNAKKRVAVVLQLLGDSYHEKSFNVRGSTKALGQIIKACKLEDKEEYPPERDLGEYGTRE